MLSIESCGFLIGRLLFYFFGKDRVQVRGGNCFSAVHPGLVDVQVFGFADIGVHGLEVRADSVSNLSHQTTGELGERLGARLDVQVAHLCGELYEFCVKADPQFPGDLVLNLPLHVLETLAIRVAQAVQHRGTGRCLRLRRYVGGFCFRWRSRSCFHRRIVASRFRSWCPASSSGCGSGIDFKASR